MTTPRVHVLGVDPGLSVGAFELVNGRPGAFWQDAHPVALAELDNYLWVLSCQRDLNVEVVVACERYQSSGQRGARSHQPEAQQVCARVQGLVLSHGFAFVAQTPADAKRFASNARLRELGLWVTARQVGYADADDVHDAARHAVLCLARSYATLYERLLESSPREA